MVHQWGFFGSISAIRKIWSLTANSRSLQAAALKCLRSRTFTSPRKNPSGIFSSSKSKFKSVGSFGLNRWRCRLAALAIYSGLGKHGQGTSSMSSNSTSSTMADAGRKMSATALALTLAVMLAANAALTSAGWLWAFEPIWKTPFARSITLALQGFTCLKKKRNTINHLN